MLSCLCLLSFLVFFVNCLPASPDSILPSNVLLKEWPPTPFRRPFRTIPWDEIYFVSDGSIGSDYDRSLIVTFISVKIDELRGQEPLSQGPSNLSIGDIKTGAPALKCNGPHGSRETDIEWTDITAIDFLQTMIDILVAMGFKEFNFEVQTQLLDRKRVVALCSLRLPARDLQVIEIDDQLLTANVKS